MNHSIFTKIFHYYLTNTHSEFICAGAREDCRGDIQRGGKQIAFGKPIENATHITLKPDVKKIQKCTNLDFLPKTLTHITIPLPLISFLDSKKLPNLQSIRVVHLREYEVLNLDIQAMNLDKNFNLKGFAYYSNYPKDTNIWMDMIDLADYQELEFLNAYIEDNQRSLDYLGKLAQVKQFFLLSDKEDFISYIPKTAELISFPCDEKSRDVTALAEFEKLQYLFISDGLKSKFDCKLLEKLPLKEVRLHSVYKIINPLSLLKIPTLERVEILDHRRSLKKKDIELFQNHGFIKLEID